MQQNPYQPGWAAPCRATLMTLSKWRAGCVVGVTGEWEWWRRVGWVGDAQLISFLWLH